MKAEMGTRGPKSLFMEGEEELPDLEYLPNIGKDTAAKLRRAGVNTPQELKDLGSEKAFLKLKQAGCDPCIMVLYSLEGAIQNKPYKVLTAAEKEAMKRFFRYTKE